MTSVHPFRPGMADPSSAQLLLQARDMCGYRGHHDSGLLPGCQHAWVHAASASTDAEQAILLVCETLTGIDVSRVPELLQT